MSFCARHPDALGVYVLADDTQAEWVTAHPERYGSWPVVTHHLVACQACVDGPSATSVTISAVERPTPEPLRLGPLARGYVPPPDATVMKLSELMQGSRPVEEGS